jgi:hypothetical protein
MDFLNSLNFLYNSVNGNILPALVNPNVEESLVIRRA